MLTVRRSLSPAYADTRWLNGRIDSRFSAEQMFSSACSAADNASAQDDASEAEHDACIRDSTPRRVSLRRRRHHRRPHVANGGRGLRQSSYVATPRRPPAYIIRTLLGVRRQSADGSFAPAERSAGVIEPRACSLKFPPPQAAC